ncbi:hypothetical protein [Streptomyces acidiscabies]|uniref:Uncharacterized protein n=1 Tax=Streptomyces acidiscabies TaxID=42234 RepID=A0AAP6EJW5_9ACTN|nr:hypothetical protein [Streptomyces acidiscabies]MBZ3916721.1 hypothetical protein [Streptomyces acidiscabies]MDX2965642.1 hypothetical protein [Streptomyces acidiscabies]MDX3024856.1 hypothetical protein [Streptomyces acidiscabies]MDX3795558.1 hypothetical protein [Streptomyces acidiscabies]
MRPDVQDLYGGVTGPLTARGLTCTVEYGLSDWIVHAELPDHSYLIISPPQEPPGHHPAGRPDAWTASWNRDTPPAHRLLYDSTPGGLDEAQHGRLLPLLHALDTHLDRLHVPPRPCAPPHHSQHPMPVSDFTRDLARHLPGGWQPDPTPALTGTDAAGARIWDSGPLPYTAFETAATPRSILTSGHGLQLYVMPRPHRHGQYLVLPMLPPGTGHRHVQGITAPRGIAVPADPARATAAVRRRLLDDHRAASLAALGRSSPGRLQIHVDTDARQRPRIRTGHVNVLRELLDHGARIDPVTGDCHVPDTGSPGQAQRRLAISLHRLRRRGYHVIVHTPIGTISRPPLPHPHLRGRRR